MGDKDTIYRQAAIDALGEKPLAWTDGEYELALQQQWESDVDAIKALPSAQPEILACGEGELNVPDTNVGDCSDCIKHGGDWECDHMHCRKGWLPSAQPERKKGKWILTEDDNYEYCTCSECGYQNGENWMVGSDIPFCANCGADMRGDSDAE